MTDKSGDQAPDQDPAPLKESDANRVTSEEAKKEPGGEGTPSGEAGKDE